MDEFVLWDNTTLPYKNVEGIRRRGQGRRSAVQDGRHGLEARGPGPHRVHGEEDRARSSPTCRTSRGGEAATQLVGNHTASNVNNPSENLEVWRAGQVRALCVFDKERIAVQGQGHRHAVVERHPDLQGRGARRAVPDAARDVPAGQGDARPGRVLRRPLQEGRRRPPEYKDYMEKQALKPVFLTGKDMLTFLEEDDTLQQGPDDRSGLRRQRSRAQ